MKKLWPEEAEDFICEQSDLIVSCYKHWLGRHLVPPGLSVEEQAAALFKAPFVIASTNQAADPILNYGNQTALGLWELPWSEFTKTPGRHTAEPMQREDRARFLEQVRKNGFIEDYSGIRISATGRRFKIHRATVWNLIDDSGLYLGQAVFFKEWEHL